MRPYLLLQAGLGCTLSAARLLLFVSPATFQSATGQPIWMILSGSVSILIVVLDCIYSTVHCYIYSDGSEVDQMIIRSLLRKELGIQNVNTNRTCSRTTDLIKHLSEEETESHGVCKLFPSLAILAIICLLLEFIKIGVAIKTEMLKIRRKNKVVLSKINIDLQRKNLTGPQGEEEEPTKAVDFEKSKWGSCPSVFYVESPLEKTILPTPRPVKSITHVRRLSIQCSPDKWAKICINTEQLNKVKKETKITNATHEYLNILCVLYKRPGTILYVFAILGLPLSLLMNFSSQDPSCSFLILQFSTILQRLYIYMTNPFLNCALIGATASR